MKFLLKIAALISCLFLLYSCNKKETSEAVEKDSATAVTAIKEEPKFQKAPWKPTPRLFKAENDLEAKIFEFQDSIHRASYEDRINLDAMKSAVKTMKEHGKKYPNHKKSPSYLLRAADYAQGMRDFEGALDILNILINDYQGSYERVDALYYKGYIFDRQFNDYSKAIQYYEQFLKEYPNNDLAPQVDAHLKRVRAVK